MRSRDGKDKSRKASRGLQGKMREAFQRRLTADTYFPEAQALAEFIICAERDGLDILCQCEYGQSRSAACAAAIKEYFFGNGITVFADYRYYPNQLVFNKVYDALRRVGNEIGK